MMPIFSYEMGLVFHSHASAQLLPVAGFFNSCKVKSGNKVTIYELCKIKLHLFSSI